MANRLVDVLHSITDLALKRYEGSEIDIRAQINALEDLVVSDVVEDIEKLAKNG